LGISGQGLRFSAVSDIGHAELIAAIVARANDLLPAPDGISLTTAEADVLETIARKLEGALERDALELRAEILRQALEDLNRITGRAGVEDMLDALFARFCVGK